MDVGQQGLAPGVAGGLCAWAPGRAGSTIFRSSHRDFGGPWVRCRSTTEQLTAIKRGDSRAFDGQTKRLDPKRLQEIDELQQAAHRAQFRYKTAVNAGSDDIMGRAGATLVELTAILEYYYDDDEETVEDIQLERLGDEHTQPTSHDAMALALDDYAAMSEPIRAELDGLADFSVQTIDAARELARQLRERSAPTVKNSAPNEALRLRNQIWTLLHQRMREVRRTARVVFRKHPEILRLATSSYQRRKRAEYVRRQRSKGTDPTSAAPPTVAESG